MELWWWMAVQTNIREKKCDFYSWLPLLREIKGCISIGMMNVWCFDGIFSSKCVWIRIQDIIRIVFFWKNSKIAFVWAEIHFISIFEVGLFSAEIKLDNRCCRPSQLSYTEVSGIHNISSKNALPCGNTFFQNCFLCSSWSWV